MKTPKKTDKTVKCVDNKNKDNKDNNKHHKRKITEATTKKCYFQNRLNKWNTGQLLWPQDRFRRKWLYSLPDIAATSEDRDTCDDTLMNLSD